MPVWRLVWPPIVDACQRSPAAADEFTIKPSGDRTSGVAGGVFAEDATNDLGLLRHDFGFARFTGNRPIAVRPTTRMAAASPV